MFFTEQSRKINNSNEKRKIFDLFILLITSMPG